MLVDISKAFGPQVRSYGKVLLLIFIQLNMSQSPHACHDILTFRRTVWLPFSKHVSNFRVRDEEELISTIQIQHGISKFSPSQIFVPLSLSSSMK